MPDLMTGAIASWLDTHGSAAVCGSGKQGPLEEEGSVLPAVVALGTALDACHAEASAQLEAALLASPAAAGLRTVMAHLGGPRRLRLLHWVAESGFADVRGVLAHLTEADPSGGGIFLKAWIADLHRRQVLERVFDPHRIATLLAACKAADTQEKPA